MDYRKYVRKCNRRGKDCEEKKIQQKESIYAKVINDATKIYGKKSKKVMKQKAV